MLVSSPAHPRVGQLAADKTKEMVSPPNAQARILRQLLTKQPWPTKKRMCSDTERHLDTHTSSSIITSALSQEVADSLTHIRAYKKGGKK